MISFRNIVYENSALVFSNKSTDTVFHPNLIVFRLSAKFVKNDLIGERHNCCQIISKLGTLPPC